MRATDMWQRFTGDRDELERLTGFCILISQNGHVLMTCTSGFHASVALAGYMNAACSVAELDAASKIEVWHRDPEHVHG